MKGHEWIIKPGLAFEAVRQPPSTCRPPYAPGVLRGDFKIYSCRLCETLCVPILGKRMKVLPAAHGHPPRVTDTEVGPCDEEIVTSVMEV